MLFIYTDRSYPPQGCWVKSDFLSEQKLLVYRQIKNKGSLYFPRQSAQYCPLHEPSTFVLKLSTIYQGSVKRKSSTKFSQIRQIPLSSRARN